MQKHRPIVINLTDAQIEAIADRAVEKLDARIGKSVRTRALWILGLALSALISLVAGALFLK